MGKHLKSIENWAELAESANSLSEILQRTNARNARQLRRQSRQRFGISTIEWLEAQKLQRARRLLLDGEQIKNVATALGYKHVSNFSLWFTRHAEMSPGEFVRANAGRN